MRSATLATALLALVALLLFPRPLAAGEKFDRLLEDLRSTDDEKKERAFTLLERMGPVAARAGPVLIEILLDGEDLDRFAAANVLKAIGTDLTGLVERLAKELGSEAVELRVRAASSLALIHFSEAAKARASEVAARLTDEDATVRAAAAGCLLRFRHEEKKAFDLLVTLLGDERAKVRLAAVAGMMFARNDPDGAAKALGERLTDSDVLVRRRAAESLFVLIADTKTAAAVDALEARVADYDEEKYVRGIAARAIGLTGAGGRKAVMTLFTVAAHHETGFVARSAAGSILILGRHSVPTLKKLLRHENVRWRVAAIRMLAAMRDKEAAAAVSSIGALLRDENVEIRREAAKALVEMGAMARRVRGALTKAAEKDEDAVVRALAARALRGLSGK